MTSRKSLKNSQKIKAQAFCSINSLARVRAIVANSVEQNYSGKSDLIATSSAKKENHYGKRLSDFSL
jgi:hypothetical protein